MGGGSSSTTNSADIYADNAGHIYTTGNTNGNLEGNTKIGLKDGYLTKYDLDGNQIWTRVFGTSGSNTSSKGMSSDIYGGLSLTGDTDGNLDGQSKSGTEDSFLIKYK
ncbi:SBBP repeat-containing protein [Leptospira idonii]|uniref:SBBP repeat-containing protein n=1 Tax=Leptospira idonii TaxID=1193500 RepID=UPI001FE5A6BE|nr:SBBP repeat-containing protein [Leptospira idonii]